MTENITKDEMLAMLAELQQMQAKFAAANLGSGINDSFGIEVRDFGDGDYSISVLLYGELWRRIEDGSEFRSYNGIIYSFWTYDNAHLKFNEIKSEIAKILPDEEA